MGRGEPEERLPGHQGNPSVIQSNTLTSGTPSKQSPGMDRFYEPSSIKLFLLSERPGIGTPGLSSPLFWQPLSSAWPLYRSLSPLQVTVSLSDLVDSLVTASEFMARVSQDLRYLEADLTSVCCLTLHCDLTSGLTYTTIPALLTASLCYLLSRMASITSC